MYTYRRKVKAGTKATYLIGSENFTDIIGTSCHIIIHNDENGEEITIHRKHESNAQPKLLGSLFPGECICMKLGVETSGPGNSEYAGIFACVVPENRDSFVTCSILDD